MVLCQVSLRKSLRDSSHVNEETDQILDHSPTWAFLDIIADTLSTKNLCAGQNGYIVIL